MKIDWPVICAFVVMACLALAPGRRLDDPATIVLVIAFLIAFAGLGVGLIRSVRWARVRRDIERLLGGE